MFYLDTWNGEKKCKSIEKYKFKSKNIRSLNTNHFSGEWKKEKKTSRQLKNQLFSSFFVQPENNVLQRKRRTRKSRLVQSERVCGGLEQSSSSSESSGTLWEWKLFQLPDTACFYPAEVFWRCSAGCWRNTPQVFRCKVFWIGWPQEQLPLFFR